ncbi:MAG: heme lyase CcmF/NrfE family subunit [Gammaproteobacteria bacterium]|jgi:cytochrome c-type biogenesis protein CcmF|nr:MAG: heme lyase CcmF/NrfE family subunit [Gammaproteobacteria bacterium]
MIVELGHLALVISLGLALLISVFGLVGAQRNQARLMSATPMLVSGQFVFIALSFVVLTHAFLTDDFSVAYVASNSNTLLPWQYKLSAVWGAHEGSFLLWILIMAGWTLAVAVKGRDLPTPFQARVLGVMGLLNLGFLAFLLFTSNPFERLVPMTPSEGADLNPLLQDFGLIVHPPMLYMGYVGFSVAFAFAVAALLSGRLDAAWARWSRPWSNVAWAFLTLGIALGSWWAYYELGWGGWWFWDPVENASFMPWLAGTALIHSLAVSEKRGTFKSWTLLLAITTFSLSLLGAFIVRSGVLTSVHAFAVDPTRGLFILIFLVMVVGSSLTLYALRTATISARASYTLASREAFLLLNNILLVISMAFVLLGTLYPLAYELATDGAKISVGVPYFNAGFIPLMLILAAALGVAPVLNWKRTPGGRLVRNLGWVAGLSLVLGVGLPLVLADAVNWQVLVTLVLAFWIIGSHGADLVRRVRKGSLPLAYLGMQTAHLGFAVTLIGVAVTSVFSVERDLRMAPGETMEAGSLSVRFVGVGRANGPNFLSDQGEFVIEEDGRRYTLRPEKRNYLARQSVMTEAAIDPGLFRDVYISLGEPLEEGAWAVRVQVKPFVRWIWLGSLLMAFGGILAVLDSRYRRLKIRQARTTATAAAAS